MVGASLGVYWTIGCFDRFMAPIGVIFFTLIFLFIFIAGVVWMGLIVRHRGYGLPNDMNMGVVFALFLIGSGQLSQCFNVGFLPEVWKGFFFSWPMLLFVVGAIGICRFHFIGGSVLAMAGVFLLLPRASAIYPKEPFYELVMSTYWPVLIMFLGVVIFFSIVLRKRHFTGSSFRERHWKRKSKYGAVSEENDGGKINYECTFGYIEQVILEPEFKGGNIKAFFGSIELDLRHTALPDGETFLYVDTVCGSIEITVPPDWRVEVVPQKTVAGSVEEQRKNAPSANPEKKLVIVAACVMGNVEIK
jgi:predicted membrane protein